MRSSEAALNVYFLGMLALSWRCRPSSTTSLRLLSLQLLWLPTTMTTQQQVSWESIKHKFVGGPYAGAGGMAIGGGSVGVAEFTDDAEAIKAIRLFPGVLRSFAGLGPDATDDQITQAFLPALKVMLPHQGYFHDTLYNIQIQDDNTITCTTGDMQLTAPRNGNAWGVPQRDSPVFTTMRVLDDKVEMDLHHVEKWAWLKPKGSSSPEHL